MRKILAILSLFASVAVAGCEAGPGCFERTFRNGETLIECR